VSETILAHADRLQAIGCYCNGTNQVDLRAAERKSVAVFNAPHANTRSVAELVIGLCVLVEMIHRDLDEILRYYPDYSETHQQHIGEMTGLAPETIVP
jgi:phosphoglycerate dehydrogenase-like enzyme